jgi:tetratricopeptide (TPR) repeat protein
MELREAIVRESEHAASNLLDLGRSYNNLNVTRIELGRLDDAESLFRRSLELYQELVKAHPSVNAYRSSVAHAHYNLGYVQRLMGRPGDAEAAYRRSLEVYGALAREYPTVGEYSTGVGMVHFNLGILQSVLGQKDKAAESWSVAAAAYASTADNGHKTVENYTGLGDALAMLGKWKEAAEAFGKAAEGSDRHWKPLYQAALLEWGAGDEQAYRAACGELVNRHGHLTGTAEAVAIAMACMAGPAACGDMETVLGVIQRAAEANPRNPVLLTLVGAVQYRAGRTSEATATLKKSVPMHSFASLAAPKQLDHLHISRLTGETILALAYQDTGDQAARDKQVESLRRLVEKLEAATPQYSEGLGRWALPLTIHCARRNLAQLEIGGSR